MNYEGITSALIELRQLKKEIRKLSWDMEDALGEKSPIHFKDTERLDLAYKALWQDLFTYTYKLQELLGEET